MFITRNAHALVLAFTLPVIGCVAYSDENKADVIRKLERERMYIARKHDQMLQIEEKKRWKQIHKDNRQRMRIRGR